MLFSIFINLFLLNYINEIYTLKIPPSFSNNQKSYTISGNNVTYITILDLLSKLELDYHLNVVLLGDIFNEKSVKILSESTSKLSKTASFYYPYTHIYEKTLFHFSLDKGLENKLRQLVVTLSKKTEYLDGSKELKDSINDVLEKYQDNDGVTNSLFVLYGLFENNELNFNCDQNTHISLNSNIAWLDLPTSNNNSSELTSHRDDSSLDLISYPKFNVNDDNKWYKLASLLFQSAEALNPVPFNSFSKKDNSNNNKNNLLPKQVDILIINICMDVSNNDNSLTCLSEDSYINSIKILSNSYSSTTTKVGYTSISIMLSKDPSLLYNIYKSIKSNNIDNEYIISSKDLLYWIMSNRIVKNEISKIAISKIENKIRILIPIIYLQNIDSLNSYYIDKESNLIGRGNMNLLFDHHWGQVYNEDNNDNNNENDLIWPNNSLIIINNKKDIDKKISTGLKCNGNIIYISIKSFIDYELFYNLRSEIWPVISHPKYYYNYISNTMLESYLWYNAPFTCNKNSDNNNCFNTFREKRILKKYEFISKSEFILSNLYSAIKKTVIEVPDLNINKLFEVGNIKRMVQNKSSKLAKQIINKYKWRDDTKNIFEEFLILMDEAIIDFSHLYYDISLVKLNNAESYAIILIDRLTDISKSKTEELNCGINNNIKIIKMDKRFDSNLFLYILISVTVSGLLGYYYSSLKYKSPFF